MGGLAIIAGSGQTTKPKSLLRRTVVKILISTTLNDHEASILANIKEAMARNDNSINGLVGALGNKALQINEGTLEVALMLLHKAAVLLAEKAQERYSTDAEIEHDVVNPLTAFAQSYAAEPGNWLSPSTEGIAPSPAAVAGFLKALRLMQENHDLRIDLLEDVNASLEKSVISDGKKIVIDAKTSKYTHASLKPISKRDLTAQIMRLVDFITNNPSGFAAY